LYFLCVGHSHLDAVMYSYMIDKPRGFCNDIELEFVHLHEPGAFEHYNAGPAVLTEALRRKLTEVEVKRGGPPAAVFMSVGGSNQHMISLVNHEQPMDFIVPWQVDAPITPGATLVPFRMVERLLQQQSQWKLNLLSLLAANFTQPKFFFQAPPPIASEEHLRSHPGEVFKVMADERGFSPLAFRCKLAELHTRMYRHHCASVGVMFLAPPARALDENGCLAVSAAAPDSIHASTVYGAYLIDQIRAVRDQKLEKRA
jgi:hypothetical protein